MLTVMEPWSTGGRPVGLERPRQVYEEGAKERVHRFLEVAVKAALEAGVPVSTEQDFNEPPTRRSSKPRMPRAAI